MIVDFHTHTFPEALADKAIPNMAAAARIQPYLRGTPDQLLASMKQAGIGVSVVLPVATNVRQPRKLNDLAARQNEAFSGTGLVSFGAMHPDDPNWKSELRFLGAHGFRGIKLHPMYQNVPFDDIRTLRILEEASSLGLLITVHAGMDVGIPGPALASPAAIYRAQRETGASGIIAAHMGGWKMWQEVKEVLAGAPVYLDTSFSFGRMHYSGEYPRTEEELLQGDTALLTEIIRLHGADRVLFGSDSPWGSEEQELSVIRSLDLSPKEIGKITGGNAERLLGLSED